MRDANRQGMTIPTGGIYQRDDASTYIKKPPYVDNMVDPNAPLQDFHQMRVLAFAGRTEGGWTRHLPDGEQM